MLGFEPDEFPGNFESFQNLLHPDDRSATLITIQNFLAKGSESFAIEFRLKLKKGGWCSILSRGKVVERDAEGRAVRMVGTNTDISERKQMEQKMRLNTAALAAAANAIILVDRSGKIIQVNAAFTTLTGYSEDEAIGKSPQDLVKSGKTERAVYQDLWETILAGRVWRGELVNRRKDGTFYPEEQTITPVCDGAGEITHFIAIKQDLTERRRAEAELKLFRALVERSSDGIYVLDTGTARYLDANSSGCIALGYTRSELLEKALFDAVPEVSWATFNSDCERMRNSGPITVESAHRRKNGTTFLAEVSLSIVMHDREYIVAIVRDITARKRAEQELDESRRMLEWVIDNIPQHVFWKDRELNYLGANTVFARSAGLAEPKQIIGKSDFDLSWKESAEAYRADDRAVIERGVPRLNYEEAQERLGGSRRWLRTSKLPLLDDTGKIMGVLGIYEDITESKLLEEQFLQAQKLESLGMLAAGIAHDLNNVLAPIMFGAPMLRGSLSSADDLKILETIEQSTERGAGLVRQILGFSRGTSGDIQPTQLKHVMRDVISAIELTFPKSIQIEQHVPSDLWLVRSNATQVHQVLLNLCINARDAMPQGGSLRVSAANRRLDEKEARSLAGATPGPWIVLEISDTGTGIAPDVLSKVWDPFFTTKALGKGTGLGLSSVRTIVANHNGIVTLDTQLGKGTTFRVFLPAEVDKPAGKDVAPVADVPCGDNELILVVDDDKAIRDDLAMILPRHRYRVLTAGDGVEAAELFLTHTAEIALVVTDMEMPRMGGAALIRVIAKLRPGIRVLGMSGLPSRERKDPQFEAAKNLANSFVLKPFTPDVFLRAVWDSLHPQVKP